MSNNFFDTLASTFQKITEAQPAPSKGLSLVVAAVALAFTFPPAWTWTRNFITIAHEGGHALVGLFFGRILTGIKLRSDTSGVTTSRGKDSGFGMIITVMAGYTAPALIALSLANLLARGYVLATLVLLSILLALMFLMIRNIWGFLTVGPLGYILYLVSTQTSSIVQNVVLLFIVWFLALGSVRPIIELQIKREREGAKDSDADQLQKLTHVIPGIVWVLFFAVVEICALTMTINLLLF